MLTFYSFIAELAGPQPMQSSGPMGDRHAGKYLSSDKIGSTTYTTTGGKQVRVHRVYKQEGGKHDGKWFAHVSHVENPDKEEHIPISRILKPTHKDIRKKETSFVTDLHNQITGSKRPVMMYDRHGNKHRIVGAQQVSGNPKADIALVNDKGEHVIHISHKESEESHQGYGGLNGKKNQSHPVMKEFAEKIKKKIPDEHMALKGKSRTMPLDHTKPEHDDMIKKALFGQHHDSDKSGPENVDVISHGKMNLKFNNRGVASIKSDKDVTHKNYKDQKYEIVAKHATDRTIPGTKIGGIVGITHAGHRKGRDVKPLEGE